MKIDDRTKESLIKVFLRSIPFFSAGPEMYDLLRDFRKSQTEFDQQVTAAVEGLRNTSALVASLQRGVEDRMEKLQQLRDEHEKYSVLAQIEAQKAEVLLQQVEATLGKEQRKERWIALLMHLTVGFLFFVLGVVSGDHLKAWMLSIWARLFP